jgi:hypothetical protein
MRFWACDEKRLAAPQKTIYNRIALNGTRLVAPRYLAYGLIFHFAGGDVTPGRSHAA